jgi:phosphomannomutase
VTPSLSALRLPADVQRTLSQWLSEPRFASEREALQALVAEAEAGSSAALAEIVDAFSQVLPIGTGGRRGKVGPGPNRFNKVVVRETAQGLAQAVRASGDTPKVAVVYDTRTHSREFAFTVAEQCAASGLQVILLDAPRPTPELSFLVRRLGCGAGVVISASHNPPEDNGIKIYGPDGAQVLGARDAALMRAILSVEELPPLQAEHRERIDVLSPERVAAEADPPYHAYVLAQGVGPSDLRSAGLRVVYTPLHGVGHTSVLPALRARGIEVLPVERQCDPDGGRFSTVRSANPEAPESMTMAIHLADETGADLVLATDPDADRLGACVRGRDGKMTPIDGNRLGVLMLDHVLQHATLPANGWVLTTLVTTPLIATMAASRGLAVVDDLLVGFKHHAGMAAEQPERTVVFACEESHGYLRGDEIRDKDGSIAALLLAEAAALAKLRGETLLDVLDSVWCRFGYHREKTLNYMAPGLAGRQAIAALMQAWRTAPPAGFAGLTTRRVEDRMQPRHTGSPTRDLPGDVLSFELEGEAGRRCRLVLRPSGTEPKLKIYGLARSAPELERAALPAVAAQIDAVVEAVLADAHAQIEAMMRPFLAPGSSS